MRNRDFEGFYESHFDSVQIRTDKTYNSEFQKNISDLFIDELSKNPINKFLSILPYPHGYQFRKFSLKSSPDQSDTFTFYTTVFSDTVFRDTLRVYIEAN